MSKLAAMHGLFSRAVGKLTQHSAPQPVPTADNELPLSQQPDRQVITVRGKLNAVTVQPVGDVSAVEAELDDGSDDLTLIWLGRQDIAGIHTGAHMMVRGRIGRRQGQRVLFNPYYVLQP